MSEALRTIEKSIRKQQTTYYGKYRAFVADNEDPDGMGRIKLTIPSVLGEATSDWALPAVAYGGGADFGTLFVPPVGAQVLAEFLEGDPSAPVWADMPPPRASSMNLLKNCRSRWFLMPTPSMHWRKMFAF